MPITKTMAYKVGEKTFNTFEEAQVQSISELILPTIKGCPAASDSADFSKVLAGAILDHAEELIEILNCDPENDKPVRKPRSDKGKKRNQAEAINRALQDGKQ